MGFFHFFILFLFAMTAWGQNVKLYKDAYGTQGEITYTGTLPDSVLPEKGSYSLRWRDMNLTNISTYYTNGKLDLQQPTGIWTWEEAIWKYDIHPGLQIIPDFKSHGQREMWRGAFSEGIAQGEWIYQKDSIQPVNHNYTETLTIHGTFQNGILTGKFSINDIRKESLVNVEGNCNAAGYAHGKWKFTYRNEIGNQIVEIREYDNGFLMRYELSDGVTTQKYEDENLIKTLKSISDENGTSPLYVIGDSTFKSDSRRDQAMEILNIYINKDFFGGWKHPNFYYQNLRHGIYFRRIQYPISNSEKNLADSLISKVQDSQVEIQSRLNYRNILVNRGRTDSLDLAISYLMGAQLRVNTLDSLLRASLKNPFTYINRFDTEIRSLETQLNDPVSTRGVFHPELIDQMPEVKFDGNDIQFFKSLADYHELLDGAVAPYLEMVDRVSETILNENEISSLTDLISETLLKINVRYDSLSGTGAFVKERWVVNHINSELEKFARTESYEEAKILGSEILIKLNLLTEWAPEWSIFDNMILKLREQYTVYAYNPYTGKRDIEVRLKRRFFSEVENILWPWLTTQLKTITSWEEFANHIQLTQDTFDQLSNFVSDDGLGARRLERRVRKENNPERMIRLLLNYNDEL